MFLKNTKKLAYTAILSALGLALILLGAYLPLSFVPFLGASLLLYYVFEKCGIVFGLLSGITVSLLSVLFLGGSSIAEVIPYMVLFAPHSFASFFLNKLNLKNSFVKYLIRYVILLPLFNISFYVIFKMASYVLFNMKAFVDIVGGHYFVLAIFMNVIFIFYDQTFSYIYRQLVKARIFR